MIVLDASMVIALLDGDDAHHAAATRVLADAGAVDLGISPITLAEILVGPTRDGRADQARALLDALDLKSIPWGPDTPARLAALRVASKLKLPDCCVVLAAEEAGFGTIATFDAQLARVAVERGLAVLDGGA
ncbi:MAG: type II toxin-antitoxin system VapC family toxin [Patulibacter sp.]